MADTQYPPLADPFRVEDVPDPRAAPGGSGVVQPQRRFPYQAVARPVVFDASAVVPDQPWLLLTLPRARAGLRESLTASVLLEPGTAMPLLLLGEMVWRRAARLGEASSFHGQADVVAAPDLVALALVSPMARPRLVFDSGGGSLPILTATPFPGDLATTVVAGDLPIAILPSGMTPGDDTDG